MGIDLNSCGSECTASVEKCTFTQNEFGLGGHLWGEDDVVDVSDTFFLDNANGSVGGWLNITDCTFSGNNNAILGGFVNLESCTITDNIVGIEGGDSTIITNCYIANNTDVGVSGLREGYSYSSTLEGNRIENNRIGVTVIDHDGMVVPIHNNSICNNTEYDVRMETSSDIDATYNWWCTIDPTVIASKVYDVYDDNNMGRVLFEPFLEEEP
jgi:hypothetical protein